MTILPLGNGLLVYWDELSDWVVGDTIQVRLVYATGKEEIFHSEKGVYVEELKNDTLQKVCVEDLHDEIEKCIQEPQIRQFLEIEKHHIPIHLESEHSKITADWTSNITDSSTPMKYYHGFWIAGISHHFKQITNSGSMQSSIDLLDPCERYIFALYEVQPNNTWIELGHVTSHAANGAVDDLEALPYGAGKTIVSWVSSRGCDMFDTSIHIETDSKTYEQSIDIRKDIVLLETSSIVELGKTFTLNLVVSHSKFNYLLANTTKKFLHTEDPNLKWFSSELLEDKLTATWQKRSVTPEKLIAVWKNGERFSHEFLADGSTEATLDSPDYCEYHELTLIEWYSSGKRVFLGQTQLNPTWEKHQQTSLFPVKDGLLLHWHVYSLCNHGTYRVQINGSDLFFSEVWNSGTRYLFVPTLLDIKEVDVTYIAEHSQNWQQQFTVRYHLQKKHDILLARNIRYESEAVSLDLELPLMDPSELEVISFDEDNLMEMTKRRSTDTGPVILRAAPCKPFEMAIVQMIGDYTRVLLGSVKIEPGRIQVTGVKSNEKNIRIDYVTEHCRPNTMHVHVTHPFVRQSPKTSVSPGYVELTQLEPCVIYDVQLIAFYEPSYYSVSEVKRTAPMQGFNEPTPEVSIENDIMVIQWKPRAECHLESIGVIVLKDDVTWKTQNVTHGEQKITLPVPRTNAIYTVSIEFVYLNQFVDRSKYVVVNYSPELHPELELKAHMGPDSVLLSWDLPKSYSPLYYRLDGLYNNGEEFIKVVLDQECVLPILERMEYVNIIVSAVSVDGIKQTSSRITVRPRQENLRTAGLSTPYFFGVPRHQ
ncbi:hypothetical protein D915_000290 [Fasciola hepatica]|uniref:Fibronectin type III domain protein n=1 Tax=Fasciola hepatica TaxID=6192 RepID=A0A4E0RKG5_FASHE|nr:hypothetical protein D915_000290 [Fasciola hepatica]